MILDQATLDHGRGHAIAAYILDFEPHFSVVDEKIGARFQGGENLRMGNGNRIGIVTRFAAGQVDQCTLLKAPFAADELTQAQLWPLEIDEDRDGTADVGFDRPYSL